MKLLALAILALLLPAGLAHADPVAQGPKNVPAFAPAFLDQTRAPAVDSGVRPGVTTVASGLSHPWGIAVLPDGSYLVTERDGRMRRVGRDGAISKPIAGVPKVVARRQGGLLDVALSPDFTSDRLVFWAYSKPLGGGRSATAVAAGRLSADMTRLDEVHDIVVQHPPSPTPMHYGSRITPQGPYLWITMGEHSTGRERRLAQDVSTTYGKTLRIYRDGAVPHDNPFVGRAGADPAIWSFGHRNPQGAALDRRGRYWIVEHGPRGGDELNRPLPGRNYGWPVISYGVNYNGTPVGAGETARQGMEQPVYYWDPVIAPGGMLFYSGRAFPAWRGSLIIASLRPGGLNRLVLKGDRVVGEEKLVPDLGRIRDVEQDSDGTLLLLTDQGNGAILRLSP